MSMVFPCMGLRRSSSTLNSGGRGNGAVLLCKTSTLFFAIIIPIHGPPYGVISQATWRTLSNTYRVTQVVFVYYSVSSSSSKHLYTKVRRPLLPPTGMKRAACCMTSLAKQRGQGLILGGGGFGIGTVYSKISSRRSSMLA